jgi:hypothetical protein
MRQKVRTQYRSSIEVTRAVHETLARVLCDDKETENEILAIASLSWENSNAFTFPHERLEFAADYFAEILRERIESMLPEDSPRICSVLSTYALEWLNLTPLAREFISRQYEAEHGESLRRVIEESEMRHLDEMLCESEAPEYEIEHDFDFEF